MADDNPAPVPNSRGANPTAARAPSSAPRTRRASFWSQNLKYPAIAVAVIGALSSLLTQPVQKFIDEAFNGKAVNSGERLTEFLKKNYLCTRVPGEPFDAPNNVKVLATICSQTGDIYLAFFYTDDGESKMKYGGIFLNETLKSGSSGIVVAGAADEAEAVEAFAFLGTGAAYAAPAISVSPSIDTNMIAGNLILAQSAPVVLCQAFPSGSIVRKIQMNGQCFVETINPATGMVVSLQPVPCDAPCP